MQAQTGTPSRQVVASPQKGSTGDVFNKKRSSNDMGMGPSMSISRNKEI